MINRKINTSLSRLALKADVISPNTIAIFHQSLLDGLNNQQRGYFVASLQEKIVGFAIASLYPIDTSDRECWLDDLGVHPEYQREGIGQKLVQAIIQWAEEEEEVIYFLLESGINNTAAHLFFELEEIGFQPLPVVFGKNLEKYGFADRLWVKSHLKSGEKKIRVSA